MLGIPPVEDSDIEDVAWALQTAASLWKRNERGDAIVWLRRAAQAAGEASMDDRALMLARSAAELTEALQERASVAPPAATAPPDQAATQIPEPVASGLDVEVDVAEEARDRLPSFPLDGDGSVRPPPPVAPENTERRRKPPLPPLSSRTMAAAPPIAEPSAPSFQEAHAGMLDPWAEQHTAEASHVERRVRRDPSTMEEDEVVTSARPRAQSHTDVMELPQPPHFPEPKGPPPKVAPPAPPRPPPPLPPRAKKPPVPAPTPPSPSPPVVVRIPSPPPPPPEPPVETPEPPTPQPVAAMEPEPPPAVEPLVAEPLPDPSSLPTPIPPSDPSIGEHTFATAAPVGTFDDLAGSLPPPPPDPEPEPEAVAEPNVHSRATRTNEVESEIAAALSAPPDDDDDDQEGTLVSLPPPPQPAAASEPEAEAAPAAPIAAPRVGPPSIEEIDQFLSEVEGLSDLPDDARAEFAQSAQVHVLAREEEIGQFALALVLGGELDVAATMVDAAAARIGRGSPLRSRGTTEEGVPLRLIAASESAIVATWNDEQVALAFKACPWVEDDLRAASDRVQTLVGVTIGPFGERLDTSLRDQIASKLEIRSLAPGEVIVAQGKPVPGLVIVGVGEVELVKDGALQRALGSGEFLFPEAILGAGAAPAEARAGKGGALVMFGNRMVAQELLVTCPPLLEVFAGM